VLTTLANALIRRRRIILVGALMWFLVAGAIGGGVAKHLSAGGFNDPAAASTKASNQLRDRFHAGNPQMVLLVTAKGARSVDDPRVAAQAQSLAASLSRETNVAQVSSYWSLGQAPPLKSKDGHEALILARLTGTDDQVSKQVKPLVPRYQVDNSVINVKIGGQAQVFNQVGSTIQKDLARAELYTFIPTLLLLILVFGSAMASLVPLAVAGLAVVSTFLALRVISSLTNVSVFALNLTTALGLALAIDFGLLMVSRYREEMRLGLPPRDAIVRTVQTAGRTVLFAASTVSISLAVLLVFPMYFLKSFAYAGIAVVVMAAVGAVIVLPAILAALDTRINLGTLWHHTPKEVGQGFWHRLAMIVMRRPVIIGGSVIAVLLVLGSPFLRVTFGLPGDHHHLRRDDLRLVRRRARRRHHRLVRRRSPGGAAQPSLGPFRGTGGDRYVAVGRTDSRTRVTQGRGAGEDDPAPAGAISDLCWRSVGPTGGLQGISVRPSAPRRWPDRPGHHHRPVPDDR
jgi:RND superfamily putative drug exporter